MSIKAICSWKRANHLLLFSKVQQERFAHGRIFLKSDMNDLLTVTLFKEPQEQSALSCSLKWGILSKRVKSKEQKCEEWKSKFPTMSKTKERYPCKVLYFQKNTRGKILKKLNNCKTKSDLKKIILCIFFRLKGPLKSVHQLS